MRIRSVYLVGLTCLVLVILGAQTPPVASSREKADPPKWEFKAVSFGGDEKEGTQKLNDLASEGWEYVGPLANGLVAFRRRAGASTPTAPPPPRAVYLMAGKGKPPANELAKHPEVRVVHAVQDLQRLAAGRTAIWIDAGALGLFGDKEKEWVIRMARKNYPFVLVGFNNALYSFREKLDCFGIKGPGPIDWTQYKLTPGFSVIMLEVKPAEGGGTQVSGFLRGYKQAPTFAAMLAVTNLLLAGKPVPESH